MSHASPSNIHSKSHLDFFCIRRFLSIVKLIIRLGLKKKRHGEVPMFVAEDKDVLVSNERLFLV